MIKKKTTRSKQSKGRHITWLSGLFHLFCLSISITLCKKKSGGGTFLKLPSILFSCSYNARASGSSSFWWTPPAAPEARLEVQVLASPEPGGARWAGPPAGGLLRVRPRSPPGSALSEPGRSRHGSGHLLPYINFCQCGKVRVRRAGTPFEWVSLDESAGEPRPGRPRGWAQLPPSKGSSTPARAPLLEGWRWSRYLRSCWAASCFLFGVEAPSSLPWAQLHCLIQTLETEQLNAKGLGPDDVLSPERRDLKYMGWLRLGIPRTGKAAGRLPQEGTLPHFSVFPARHPFLWE